MQSCLRRSSQQRFLGTSSPFFPSVKPVVPFLSEYDARRTRFASTVPVRGAGHVIRKGTGGRSSVSGIVAAVFGSTGFLGRYVVQQLAKMGSQVLVPFRGSEDSHRHLKLMGDLGQIVPMKYNPRDEDSIKAVMAKANVVINLIGREYETRNYSFEEVNHGMAKQLAMIAKEHGGIMRFIQLSCLGSSTSSLSRMLKAKATAETSVLREFPEATIMKPSCLIGTEDRILNRWAQFVKKWDFLPLMGDGSTRIQPVYVVDVAAAVIASLRDDGASMGKIYELGGPQIFTIHELAELMFDTIREWPKYVKVPFPIAKAIATPREFFVKKVPFPLPTPEIFNLDHINSLTVDTVVSDTALTFNDLGVVPRKIQGYPTEYLVSYRKGGPSYGSTVSEKLQLHPLLFLARSIHSTDDWTYAEGELRKLLGTDYLVYVSSSNTHKKTFDGIDEAGKRLADEIIQLVNQTSGLKNISFLAHSLGGLFARYAIASLYSSSMIAGLVPIHFITLATPHLGVRGNKQLPLLFGLRILEYLAPSVAPYLVGRTGYQLFLTDGNPNEPPLLLQMSSDCDDLKFISSLASFQSRFLYANMSYDHMVGWRTSSIRRKNEVVKSKPSSAESLEGYRNIVNVDYFPPLRRRGGDDGFTRETDQDTTKVNYELMEDEMISNLQSVGWKKIDVNFCSSRLPYFAHHNIHVRRKWLNNAGTDIIAHVADCLK